MQLKYLVIHCTATREGREVSAAEIRRWHTAPIAKGGDLLHLDGRVERLVRNNEDMTVDAFEITNGARGYNAIARHIVYVGGVSADGTPKDTRTEAQQKALAAYVRDFHRRFPQVRIIGHNEIVPKACPSFDVQQWLKAIGIRQL